jgi:hypothetical protein
LRVFNPVGYSPQNGLTTAHEWLPISMLPSWKLLQRDHHLNMVTGFLIALFSALHVALIAKAAQSLTKYSPWYQEESGNLQVNSLAICLPALVLAFGLVNRVRLPSRFAAKLLTYHRCRGFRTSALCVLSSLLGMLNLILVLLACVLAIPCAYFGINAPQVLLMTILGLLVLTDILRYAQIKMIFWTWDHGKRK